MQATGKQREKKNNPQSVRRNNIKVRSTSSHVWCGQDWVWCRCAAQTATLQIQHQPGTFSVRPQSLETQIRSLRRAAQRDLLHFVSSDPVKPDMFYCRAPGAAIRVTASSQRGRACDVMWWKSSLAEEEGQRRVVESLPNTALASSTSVIFSLDGGRSLFVDFWPPAFLRCTWDQLVKLILDFQLFYKSDAATHLARSKWVKKNQYLSNMI